VTKLVVLEFLSDEEADTFVGAQTTGVVGVFKKPTQFCTCTRDGRRAAYDSAHNRFWLTKGQKYGWYVCKLCGKPPFIMRQTPKNLIQPKPDPKQEMVIVLEFEMWQARVNADGSINNWGKPAPPEE
jgi:hypothetical protein